MRQISESSQHSQEDNVIQYLMVRKFYTAHRLDWIGLLDCSKIKHLINYR